MQTTTHLPDGYEAVETIDFQKDRKLAVIVNGIGFAVIIILCVMPTLFGKRGWYPKSLVQSGILALGLILYLVLHEFTHGFKTLRRPDTILVKDTGVSMTYYDKPQPVSL